MMKADWEELIKLFQQITDLYAEILELGKLKKDVLVSGEHVALEEVIAQEEKLLARSLQLETSRETLLGQMAARNGRALQELTLNRLIEMVGPGKEQSELQEIGKRLQSVIGELKDVNELNSRLTEKALFFVKCNINLLTQNVAEDGYAPPCSQVQSEKALIKRLIIDRKV